MVDMLHEIRIQAPLSTVLAALTTQDGLRSWWTSDSTAEPKVGSVAEFGFGNRVTIFRMRIEELSDSRVVWECLGDPDEWRGTRLEWNIKVREGGSIVRFTHAGWASVDGMFPICNTTWGELMHRLRDYLEGRKPGPLFSERA